MDTENRLSSCFGWLVAFLIVLVVGVAMNGWALSTIWNWFIPPIFGLAYLTTMKAIGVSMVLNLFTGVNKISSESKKEKQTTLEKFIESVLTAILVPLAYVGIGYVIYQFAF